MDIDTGEILRSWKRRSRYQSSREQLFDPIGDDEPVPLSDPRCVVCDDPASKRVRLAPTARGVWLHDECRPEAERRVAWMKARGLLTDPPAEVAPKLARKPRTRLYCENDREEARRLHRDEGYPAKTIGKLMGVPPSTVQRWISAA
ncbi:helix-turn-helix domain-containing protein [Frankia sp. AiPs1]|uniref:helix-turn-helix domain-containing protein n=1 Tax=Frankia sp. AiPs1 TaxID=573493 RepID=UPI002043F93B|nr:helix-turn-helix domain-containing protein [Frankia sp. AiPs1]MCM3920735.1 helix-turn-helix domain-containing protein [Frankia sp. AiPs1]